MSLLERLLRSLQQGGAEFAEVRIEIAAGETPPCDLPKDLVRALPVRWSNDEGSTLDRFEAALVDSAGAALLAFSAETEVDPRLIVTLCRTSGSVAFIAGSGDERGVALRLESPLLERPPANAGLVEIAEHAVRQGTAKDFASSDFPGYIPMLRRDLPAYVVRITDAASRDRAERFLFRSNYKGSTDFLTRHVYPPVVWALLRPLTRWRVHPNWITGFDWILAFAVLPLFAGGYWLSGLCLAYTMSILDSVDGKLARLTFRHSGFGEFADHGLDVLHPPLWYMAWAWWLGGGEVDSAPFEASLWLLGLYTLDRLCTAVFRKRTGTSIHGFTPLDEKVRTFISRRNVNLAFFTAALSADWIAPGHGFALAAFYFIVAWQAASLAWHTERLVRFWK